MFLKRCTRKKNGKPHTYWQLVESYRTPRGPRHQVVAYLGELDGSESRGWGRLALQLDGKAATRARQLMLFDNVSTDHDDPVPQYVEVEKVNATRLYRTLDAILPLKSDIEIHLIQRVGELFSPDFDLLLYDVTSTYFEGQAKANPQAKRGYSLAWAEASERLSKNLPVSKPMM